MSEYLTRLVLQNRYFGDDIQLIALANCEGKLRVITSQPHVAGISATSFEIQRWFSELGCIRVERDNRIAWYRASENLLVADAHEGNVIKTCEGTILPIDLNLVRPSGELFQWVNELSEGIDNQNGDSRGE